MIDYNMLSRAVIKQWSIDGKPKRDLEGVKLWAQLLELHHKQMSKAVKNASIVGLRNKCC